MRPRRVVVTGLGGTFRYEPTDLSFRANSCATTSSGEAVFAIKLEQTSTIGSIVTDDDGGLIAQRIY